MATITAREAKAVVQPRAKAAADQPEVALPSRREFLYYIWGASIVLLTGQAAAGLIWFALPRFKEGTFGGIFRITPDKVPTVGSAPYQEAAGRFWVSNTPQGVVTLYGVCTHLGCLPKWVDIRDRFECPCHGSKFELDGAYITGPAPRSLDRFVSTIYFTDGTFANMDPTGVPIPLNGRTIDRIEVDTGRRIRGDANA